MDHTYRNGFLRMVMRVAFAFVTLYICVVRAVFAADDAPPPEIKLQPVPDAASQATALKLVKELFKPYPPQRPEEKQKVAKKLMAQAAESDNDAVTQYVLLHEAAELSVSAGDIAQAMRAADEIGKHFSVDAQAEKLSLLNRAKGAHLDSTAASAGADAALQIGTRAMHKGDFAAANQASAIATTLSRQTQDVKLTMAAHTLSRDVQVAEGESARAKSAEEKLKTSPNDPAASLAVGRFLCFWRGDWARGLPLLAQCSDASLKSAAAAEIDAPKDAAGQFALAEKWVQVSTKESGTPLAQIREHAAGWYRQAEPELVGLQKTLAEKRLADLNESSEKAAFASKELALTRLLNDPAHWTIGHGEWKNQPGKLHGEGDSQITFDTAIPRDITFSFHINVLSGMRPRMAFTNTGMMFGNEGYNQGLYPFGTQVAGKKDAVPYKNNEPHLISFKLSGNQFEIEIDEKAAFSGTYQASDEPIRLQFNAGDGFSPGTTEFYGFEVQSLPKPPGQAKQ